MLSRLKHDEKINFILNIMKWQQGPDVLLHQKCFILNFGFKQSLPYPQIKLSLESQLHLNVGTFGMNSPSKCFSVVIGGKNLLTISNIKIANQKFLNSK